MAYRNIYTFGPTFRAENSNTTRHAAEFWMIEPEIAFADLKDVIKLSEDMVKYIIKFVLENAPDEMKFFNDFIDNGLLERLNSVVNSEFKVMTYTEAIDITPANISILKNNRARAIRFTTLDKMCNYHMSITGIIIYYFSDSP